MDSFGGLWRGLGRGLELYALAHSLGDIATASESYGIARRGYVAERGGAANSVYEALCFGFRILDKVRV
jgi:hypothetical protein